MFLSAYAVVLKSSVMQEIKRIFIIEFNVTYFKNLISNSNLSNSHYNIVALKKN